MEVGEVGTKTQKKVNYEPPSVQVVKIQLEKGMAQTVIVSAGVQLYDWEDGGKLGDNPDEGGDIFLMD